MKDTTKHIFTSLSIVVVGSILHWVGTISTLFGDAPTDYHWFESIVVNIMVGFTTAFVFCAVIFAACLILSLIYMVFMSGVESVGKSIENKRKTKPKKEPKKKEIPDLEISPEIYKMIDEEVAKAKEKVTV